ncbi:MAG: hypothetical protein R3293_16875 [Candidatus Promineifilaceae bacterium]|nr:hypothetical protein [Candidatus Promineifilaceae bacterium]
MENLQIMEQENTVLRWGALAGLLGGMFFILTFIVTIAGPVGTEDPVNLAGWVTRFPDIKAARIVENVIYLMALMLEVPLFLALYYALQRTRLAPALFGSVLGIMGLAAMMFSSVPHVAHAPLSDIYHTPGVSPADQATIAILWKGIWGVIDVQTYIGFFVVSAALIVLGVGMITSPDFGKGIGGAALLLGCAGLVMAVLQIVDPASLIGAGSYFASIIFYFIVGWQLFILSRVS